MFGYIAPRLTTTSSTIKEKQTSAKKPKAVKKAKKKTLLLKDILPNVPEYRGPSVPQFFPRSMPEDRSKESWIPSSIRMRWLKRDMELAKYNQKRFNDHQRTKEKVLFLLLTFNFTNLFVINKCTLESV